MKKETTDLIHFLKEKEVHEEYINLLSDPTVNGAISNGGSISSFIARTSPELWIINAFSLPKADPKWHQIAREWLGYLAEPKMELKLTDSELITRILSYAFELQIKPEQFLKDASERYMHEIDLNNEKGAEK